MTRLVVCMALAALATACDNGPATAADTPDRSTPATRRPSGGGARTGGGGAAALPMDACALITKADVEAIVGRAVREPERASVNELGACSFSDPAKALVNGRAVYQLVEIEVHKLINEEAARTEYMTGRAGSGPTEPLAGVGNAAYWQPASGDLIVRHGRYTLTISLAAEVADLERAKAIAARLLKGLDGTS